jgi:hypothetical protein
MAAMSNYLENKIIDHILRGTPYDTAPSTNVCIALFTTTPSDTGGGTEIPSSNNYTRANVAASLSGWTGTHGGSGAVSSGTSGFANNASIISFNAPSGNWGVVQGFGMYDAFTGGNLLFYGALTVPKTINNGDAAPSFAANTLCIQIDN